MTAVSVRHSWPKLVLLLAICLGVGALAGLFTSSSVQTWYPTLNKPGFTPPNWLFGPVWTFLYAAMAVAAYLVWRQGWHRPVVRAGLLFFAAQLVFNFFWSFIFFGQQQVGWGLVDILVLLVLILFTTLYFFRAAPVAGWLMVPYLGWVMYASLLNAAIWMLN